MFLCTPHLQARSHDEIYKFNMSVEEAAELAWRAFITQYSVTELVVAVFLVVDDCEVIGVLLQTELVPLCLRTMEMGSELSTLLSWLCFFLLTNCSVPRPAARFCSSSIAENTFIGAGLYAFIKAGVHGFNKANVHRIIHASSPHAQPWWKPKTT
ncbi:uncharacterized protein LOC125520579 isoform X3 [Triticum urartu]|uniref:uncharacterized protein LOC125520579 isoform X3 n=1 Tax=Triticum urartu TaxID=4572 RepID=UPI002044CDF6|nr:uncharacterized protein LOC125520579 isoform X3 [Triticum urartu]